MAGDERRLQAGRRRHVAKKLMCRSNQRCGGFMVCAQLFRSFGWPTVVVVTVGGVQWWNFDVPVVGEASRETFRLQL